MRAVTLMSVALLTTACAAAGDSVPSLAPRPAEAIDPRLAVPDTSASIPADPAFARQVAALLSQAEGSTNSFAEAIARAERLAEAAGPAESESWIAAQQALSVAIGARYPITRALGDLDALTATRLRERGGLTPADQHVVGEVAKQISAIDQSQAARIDGVQRRLGL